MQTVAETMTERALQCPQCKAPLAAAKLVGVVVCPYCGSTVVLGQATVQARRFREAFAAWNDPPVRGGARRLSIGDRHWTLGRLVAHGEVGDVYAAERARWPSERVLVKVAHDRRGGPALRHEWQVLQDLQQGDEPTAASFGPRLPQPVAQGVVAGGEAVGQAALVVRFAHGYLHTFDAVCGLYPRGIEARPAVWIWRRILELLAFLHRRGWVHGAVLPRHLLIEQGEHGVRLVGFRAAGRAGQPLGTAAAGDEAFYPAAGGLPASTAARRLGYALDLAMSARCMARLLGGDPASGEVPASVPASLAAEIARAAAHRGDGDAAAAWTVRERLGELARQVFGAPAFCPLQLPDEV